MKPGTSSMQDSWDIACVCMVLVTLCILTAIFLNTNGILK